MSLSWAESLNKPDCVRGRKVRVILDMAASAEDALTDKAVQRHIDNLYICGADLIELRRAPQLKDTLEPLPEFDGIIDLRKRKDLELHNSALPTLPSISILVQSFLRADYRATDSVVIVDVNSLTILLGKVTCSQSSRTISNSMELPHVRLPSMLIFYVLKCSIFAVSTRIVALLEHLSGGI